MAISQTIQDIISKLPLLNQDSDFGASGLGVNPGSSLPSMDQTDLSGTAKIQGPKLKVNSGDMSTAFTQTNNSPLTKKGSSVDLQKIIMGTPTDIKPNSTVATQTTDEKKTVAPPPGSVMPRQGQPNTSPQNDFQIPWSMFRASFRGLSNKSDPGDDQFWDKYDDNVKNYLMTKDMRDPNSPQSKIYQQLAKQATGDDSFSNATAMQINQALPAVKDMIAQKQAAAMLNFHQYQVSPENYYNKGVYGAQGRAEAPQRESQMDRNKSDSYNNAITALTNMRDVMGQVENDPSLTPEDKLGRFGQLKNYILTGTGMADPKLATLKAAANVFSPEMAKILQGTGASADDARKTIAENLFSIGEGGAVNSSRLDFFGNTLINDMQGHVENLYKNNVLSADAENERLNNNLKKYQSIKDKYTSPQTTPQGHPAAPGTSIMGSVSNFLSNLMPSKNGTGSATATTPGANPTVNGPQNDPKMQARITQAKTMLADPNSNADQKQMAQKILQHYGVQ